MNESGLPSLIERIEALRSVASFPTRRTSWCVALAVTWTDTVPSLPEKSESGPSIKCIVSRLLGNFDNPDPFFGGDIRRRPANWSIMVES